MTETDQERLARIEANRTMHVSNEDYEWLLAKAKQSQRLSDEVERLDATLQMIDGGDHPCTDESQLRQWAYEARTLGRDHRPPPEKPQEGAQT